MFCVLMSDVLCCVDGGVIVVIWLATTGILHVQLIVTSGYRPQPPPRSVGLGGVSSWMPKCLPSEPRRKSRCVFFFSNESRPSPIPSPPIPWHRIPRQCLIPNSKQKVGWLAHPPSAANSANCCSGSHNTPATCPPSSVGKSLRHLHVPCPTLNHE